MKYVGISYSIENIDTPDKLWEIDEALEKLISGNRVESGIGFGWRDLEFELTEADDANINTIQYSVEQLMETYNIETYEFGTHSNEEYDEEDSGPEFDGAGFSENDRLQDEAGYEDLGFGI